jgi:hypothetical protein
MEKVTKLLEDLKAEVKTNGRDEASAYSDYSCFCRDTTTSKSGSITSGQDSIGLLSADIAEKTATQSEKTSKLQERKTTQGELAAELKATEERCAKEQAEYEATDADLTKAISSLKSASDRMNTAKPASFLELPLPGLQRSLALAEAMGFLKEPEQKAIGNLHTFLQQASNGGKRMGVDPVDPEFRYHSQGIIDTIDNLHKEFTAEKASVDAEWAKAKKICDDTKKSLSDEMTTNAAAIVSLGEQIAVLKGQISMARADLQTTENVLKDDQLYLQDLTVQCEQRAKDWDQRSQLRADELEALSKALTILTDRVQSADVNVNKRALIQEHRSHAATSAIAFLQEDESKSLQRHRVHRAVTLLQNEGRRLHSAVLGSVTAPRFDSTPQYDPFVKVKDLIQKLVERLLAESTAEATKKGFCDEEMGKATQDRDARLEESSKLSVEIQGLEAKRDSLTQDIESLGDSLASLRSNLANATQIRTDEKAVNLATIKEAKEGVQAVSDALAILKSFYKQAAKAEDFHSGKLQRPAAALVQGKASPVDEDTSGPGFDNAYKGKQEASTSIIGILEVIKSDFERTIRTTEESEKQASADHVDFDRVSNTDIGGKDTKKTLNTEDLETTKNTIQQKMSDLQTAMDLLGSALKQLEELKPVCVDMTMPYAERVQKRDEEIAALKRALCILDTEGVEDECGK